MNRNISIFLILLLLIGFVSCNSNKKPWVDKSVIIDIQPFEDFSTKMTEEIATNLKTILPNINIKQTIQLPLFAFYHPRNRYRADSIIKFLRDSTLQGHVVIGLTNKDISTTSEKVKDWGIMGLGFRPGNACVVSSYRLNKKNLNSQFYKVCIHELGHTAGLPHCSERTCFMRAAEGGNPTDEEKAFCNNCRRFLIGKGWKLNDAGWHVTSILQNMC
ncbi:hypothetical protein BH11BAC3_BH11BAC3_44000 [soil metagenome]